MGLIGFDVSHHNYEYVMRHRELIANFDFVMMKATEGKTYADSKVGEYREMFDRLRGFYHYARPENNEPRYEVENFLEVVGADIGYVMLALDWEGNATKCDTTWAYEWLELVREKTGVKPLIYLPKSELPKFKKVADADYGLWIADWDNDDTISTKYTPWGLCAMKQYRVEPLDLDFFNGEITAWCKYCTGARK